MSEQPAETTAAAPDVPRQFTPDEMAAAREQLLAQGELAPAPATADAPVDQSALGMQALAAGAEADEVDTRALLESIRKMQGQIDQLNAEKRLATAPEVVKYATALADHLQARADANPGIHNDPDHTYMPALEQAASLVNAAKDAADSGNPAGLEKITADIRRFLDRHGRRFPHLDNGYLHELADSVDESAAKLAA